MSRENHLVLAVVTAPPGLLLLHRPGETPPAVLPGGRPEARESPGATAERGCLEETRVRDPRRAPAGPAGQRRDRDDLRRRPPVVEPPPVGEVAVSLHVAWYTLNQVELALPELWAPVRAYLDKALRAM